MESIRGWEILDTVGQPGIKLCKSVNQDKESVYKKLKSRQKGRAGHQEVFD